MKNRARVLDATAVYDAVATQDTVTQLRAAIRKTLTALDHAGSGLAAGVRAVLARDDDYAGPGKPPCDWDDPAAREGQDVEQGSDGVFRIARKTARDRVISTVDTQARHGHKSRNRRFDGYKAHLSVDPTPS